MSHERILIVEDEKLLRWSLKERLGRDGYEVFEAGTGEEGLALAREPGADLMLLDLRLPDTSGIEVLKRLSPTYADVPVILMTAYASVETAVEAIKLGAFDYINKPFNQDQIAMVVRKALESSRLHREVQALRHQQEERYGLRNLVGDSPAMKDVFRMITKVGRSAASTVLITGESGTGKDLVAKAIHFASDRAGGPFLNITCSALPEELLESELMGHERGAFTDAKTAKPGLFELADGGTVLLDEIGDMGLVLQAKLLRFLEEKTFKRIGGVKDIRVDVRIIAATNRDLGKAVKEGRFREDLYHRIKVIPVTLPPLRHRREDIPLLVKHFIDEFNIEFKKHCRGVTDQAMELLIKHEWPGNIRELRNAIERAMLLEERDTIDVKDLPQDLARPAMAPVGEQEPTFHLPDAGYRLQQMECDLVRQALEKTGGNQTHAARLLSISRDALRYKMKKFHLE